MSGPFGSCWVFVLFPPPKGTGESAHFKNSELEMEEVLRKEGKVTTGYLTKE